MIVLCGLICQSDLETVTTLHALLVIHKNKSIIMPQNIRHSVLTQFSMLIMKLKTQKCTKERSLNASKLSLLGSGGVDCLGPSKVHSRSQGGLGLEDDWELTGDFAHFSLSGLLALV